jgi:hypothetical protein
MYTMRGPHGDSTERTIENSRSSFDPRNRISPERVGISSLAAAAGN